MVERDFHELHTIMMAAGPHIPSIGNASRIVCALSKSSIPGPTFPALRICSTRQSRSSGLILSKTRFQLIAVTATTNGSRVAESEGFSDKNSSQHKGQPRLVVILGKGGSGRTTASVMLAQVRWCIAVSHSVIAG